MTQAAANCPPEGGDARRIVIVGGGYAGTTCAVELGRRLPRFEDAEILMVEPNPCQQALSELDLVAVGPPKAEFCELQHPIVFKNLPVHVCYTTVESIDPQAREVQVAEGQRVSYWRLVIATGAIPFVPDVPGLAEHALTMWSVLDARKLQRRVERQFRVAAKLAHRDDRR
ncbi:MAG: FAD-dependent oxidoreductase, partial [Coriobacteriales bacterium]|nr:FAD-dependent oxidoreductase [Coriobacteriales bacterium]